MMRNNLVPFNSMDLDSPWKVFQDLEREMNRVFKNFFPEVKRLEERSFFTPHCDVDEAEDHFSISLDLPGVKKDDIKVELHNGQLLIQGKRKHERKEKRKEGKYMEKSYGSFDRFFILPQQIDSEKIEAHFEDGVLSLYVPKTEANKPKRIPIGTEQKGLLGKILGNGRSAHHKVDKSDNIKEGMKESA